MFKSLLLASHQGKIKEEFWSQIVPCRVKDRTPVQTTFRFPDEMKILKKRAVRRRF
jgi:hypothetical protein